MHDAPRPDLLPARRLAAYGRADDGDLPSACDPRHRPRGGSASPAAARGAPSPTPTSSAQRDPSESYRVCGKAATGSARRGCRCESPAWRVLACMHGRSTTGFEPPGAPSGGVGEPRSRRARAPTCGRGCRGSSDTRASAFPRRPHRCRPLVRAVWRRWDLVDRLTGERDAYVISEVLAYASREATMETEQSSTTSFRFFVYRYRKRRRSWSGAGVTVREAA
jgi:hypothetical protein